MPIVKIEELIKPVTPSIEKNEFDWKEMIMNEIRDYNIHVRKLNEKTRMNNDKKINYEKI
jgi:CTP:phosphocholine cytidylyltransferase-like protein